MEYKISKLKQLIATVIAFLMLLIANTGTAFGVVTSGDGSTVEKAKVINAAYNDRVVQSSIRFKFGVDNCSATWNKDYVHKTIARTDDKKNDIEVWGLKYNTKTITVNKKNHTVPAATTYTNPLSLTFKNCGKINGREVNVKINFDKITVSQRANNDYSAKATAGETSGYFGILNIAKKNSYNHFQLSSSSSTGGGFRGKKTFTLTTTVSYADTGEVVQLPFFLAVQDIDKISSWNGTVYATESWTSGTGFKSFYIYNTNKNKRTGNTISATDTTNTWTDDDPAGAGTTGSAELTVGGMYAVTNKGQFTCTFTDGNCGTQLKLYSQYKDGSLSMPTKSVDKSTAKPTDTLTYNVDQKIGTYITTMMEPYGKLKITDTVPNYLTYVDGSAKLYSIETIKVGPQEEEREIKTDITNQANISYSSSNKLLTCELKDSWRTNVANYKGQTLRLEFKGKISKITPHNTNIKNTGHVQVETSLTNDTNEVNTLVQKHKPGDSATYVRIRIRIKDDKNVLMDAHGKPTFIFKITANGREYYRSVTFGDDEASKDWTFEKKNGYIIATGKMEDLRESGENKVTCEVSTVDVSRFKVTAEDMIPEFPKEDSDDVCFTYPFVAEKTTWQYYSHNDIKVNRLTK